MTYLSLFQDDALQLSERASLDRKRACKLAHAAFSELSGQAVKTVAGRTPLSLVRTKPALADIGPVNSASESAPESAPKSAPERAPVRAPARASAPESAPESAPVSAPVLRRRANLTAKKAAGKDSGPVLCACEKIHRRQSGPARLDADLRPEAHAAAATHSGFVSVALLNRRPDPANIPFPDVGRHQALGCPQPPTPRLPRTAPARAPPLPMANDDPALSGQRPRGHIGPVMTHHIFAASARRSSEGAYGLRPARAARPVRLRPYPPRHPRRGLGSRGIAREEAVATYHTDVYNAGGAQRRAACLKAPCGGKPKKSQ